MASTRVLLLIFGTTACTPRTRAPEIDTRPPVLVAPASSPRVEIEVGTVVPEAPMPTEPFTLRDDLGRAIEVYPPTSKPPRAPIVAFLHATCMQPSSVCDWFGRAGRDTGWLVCPSGNSTCYGEPDWHGSGPEKAAFLASAIAKVEAQVPSFVDERPGVLIGWSRGAFAARDILYASLSDPKSSSLARRFHGLVLLAAHVEPDAAKLKKAGITRVVMAAGDYDGSKPTMTSAVAALTSQGLEARYVSLGKIAHVWPEDFETRMREPIAWASAGP